MSDDDATADEPETTDEPEPADEPEPEESEPEHEPEPEQGDTDEPEADDAEPDEPAGPSAEQMDRAFSSVERRAKTWVTFVANTASDLGQPLVACPCCLPAIPGFLFDPSEVPLQQAQLDGARELLGQTNAPTYEQSPDDNTCPRCGGWGRLLTGSKVSGQNVVTCRECKGRGFVGTSADILPSEAPGLAALAPVQDPTPADTAPTDDVWGTPVEHPDHGRAPQYRAPGWQAELERYKLGLGPEAPLPQAAGVA